MIIKIVSVGALIMTGFLVVALPFRIGEIRPASPFTAGDYLTLLGVAAGIAAMAAMAGRGVGWW